MKTTKRILAMLLAIVMVMGLATTAFAANENEHTITVNNNAEGYEYVAYQIFQGDLVDGQLQNIAWGKNITDGEALLTALQANEAFAECETVVDVATVLGEITEKDHETTMAFADIVAGFLTEEVAGTSEYAEEKYTIPVVGDGYYLVKNTKVPAATETTGTGAYTRYILKVVGDVNVNHKGEIPKVEKKIKEGDKLVDANTADIGDTITYQITGTMPTNIADYDTYYYLFTDNLSKGLTYTNNVTVTVNGVDVTKYFYIDATVTETDTDVTVGILDILALENVEGVGTITADTKVVLTYTALLNENAVIGVNGNPNDVKLDYSNDPNLDGDGATEAPKENPDKPVPTTPHGETPVDTVITYTTEIKVTKVDGLTQEILTGAKFKIEGVSSNVKVINKEMYVPYAEGETAVEGNVWYMLKDGTYTQTAPVLVDDETTTDVNEDTSAAYDSTTKTYKKIEVVSTETVETPFVAEGWVNAEGVLTFTGLGEGTYTITEIVAPNGYNLLTAPIVVVIDSNAETIEAPIATTTVTWTATVDGNEATVNNGVVELVVENISGSTLPETGGMGTTLFYIVGGIMMMAALVLLVTKRRMSAAE